MALPSDVQQDIKRILTQVSTISENSNKISSGVEKMLPEVQNVIDSTQSVSSDVKEMIPEVKDTINLTKDVANRVDKLLGGGPAKTILIVAAVFIVFWMILMLVGVWIPVFRKNLS